MTVLMHFITSETTFNSDTFSQHHIYCNNSEKVAFHERCINEKLKLYEHNRTKHKPASNENLLRGLTILKVKPCIYTTINHNIWKEYPLTTTLNMDMQTSSEA